METPESGHSEEFAPVRLAQGQSETGRIEVLRPVTVDEKGLVAEIV